MDPNRPEIVAEVAEAVAAYEKALIANDAEGIMGFFRDSPDVVRFGVADHQAGWAEQQRWRHEQPPLPPGRTLAETSITTFGADVAVVTMFFTYPGSPVTGRQSQTWCRLPVGWRIVTAHVSHPAD